MSFIFEQLRSEGDTQLAYLIGDRSSKVAAVIDPSHQSERLVDRALRQGLKINYIINTHGHTDTVVGNDHVKKTTGAQVAAYHQSSIHPDIALDDGHLLQIGNLVLKCIWTPGHSGDHIVIYVADLALALTGDLLLVGQVGGTMTEEAAEQQYRSLQRLIREVPASTTLWPGHDVGCRPSSTMAWERLANPFLLVKDFPSFMMLKISWPTYKAEYGLR